MITGKRLNIVYRLNIKGKGQQQRRMLCLQLYLLTFILAHYLTFGLAHHVVMHQTPIPKPSSCSALACYLALVPNVPDGSCALSIAFDS